MKLRSTSQYSIRGVSKSVDGALKKKAAQAGKSLNAIVLEALERAAGLSGEPRIFTDLDHLAGSWVEDPEFDEAVSEQRRIDPNDWT